MTTSIEVLKMERQIENARECVIRANTDLLRTVDVTNLCDALNLVARARLQLFDACRILDGRDE